MQLNIMDESTSRTMGDLSHGGGLECQHQDESLHEYTIYGLAVAGRQARHYVYDSVR